MASQIPQTMRALALAKHCTPSEYNIATLPVPKITRPDELLIKVHAVSVNPIDVKMAGSLGKLMMRSTFPMQMGHDAAGTVVSVGTLVTKFKPGDEVYTCVEDHYRSSFAQYCLSTESATALKPASSSFIDAASVPLAALTAIQALEIGEKNLPGGLKGKTVFITAGLSGTGHFGVQLAKNVFGAGKVITTLSTGKIPKIKKYLGDSTPDQIVDYTKGNVVNEIGKNTVDFMFDTTRSTISDLGVMKKGGMIISISTLPSGTEARKQYSNLSSFLVVIMNFADWVFRTWTGWKGVKYQALLMWCSGPGLETLAKCIQEGKVKPIVGSVVKLEDIEGVRRGCQQVYDAKGGLGKFVIEVE